MHLPKFPIEPELDVDAAVVVAAAAVLVETWVAAWVATRVAAEVAAGAAVAAAELTGLPWSSMAATAVKSCGMIRKRFVHGHKATHSDYSKSVVEGIGLCSSLSRCSNGSCRSRSTQCLGVLVGLAAVCQRVADEF